MVGSVGNETPQDFNLLKSAQKLKNEGLSATNVIKDQVTSSANDLSKQVSSVANTLNTTYDKANSAASNLMQNPTLSNMKNLTDKVSSATNGLKDQVTSSANDLSKQVSSVANTLNTTYDKANSAASNLMQNPTLSNMKNLTDKVSSATNGFTESATSGLAVVNNAKGQASAFLNGAQNAMSSIPNAGTLSSLTGMAKGMPAGIPGLPKGVPTGIPGMPGLPAGMPGLPAGMPALSSLPMNPDAIKQMIEDGTKTVKRELSRLPFASMILGPKEQTLLKVDKEGAKDRLCELFYKRLQKIYKTSVPITHHLDVIYGHSVNEIYLAVENNDNELSKYATKRFNDIIAQITEPFFQEAIEQVREIDFNRPEIEKTTGGGGEDGLSFQYKSFLDAREPEMIIAFEKFAGDMIDIDDAVQVQVTILTNIFERLSKSKNLNLKRLAMNIVLDKKRGIFSKFREHLKSLYENREYVQAEEPVANQKEPVANQEEPVANQVAPVAVPTENPVAPVANQKESVAVEPAAVAPAANVFTGGGRTPGDALNFSQIPDYIPSAHDWKGLKLCVTKKVAADIQASVELQTAPIKLMIQRVIYSYLYKFLTDYGKSPPVQPTDTKSAAMPEEPDPEMLKYAKLVVLKNLDEMCNAIPTEITEHIFFSQFFTVDSIKKLKFRVSSPESDYTCPNIPVKKTVNPPPPTGILTEWFMQNVIQSPPEEELAKKYPEENSLVPPIFHPTRIDQKMFKQNLWLRGINRVGKTIWGIIPFAKTPSEHLADDKLQSLPDGEKPSFINSNVRVKSRVMPNIVDSYLFYQSHPYMLKIVYDILEPILRSISEEPDEYLIRIFYYASAMFMLTVIESMSTKEIRDYIVKYTLWSAPTVRNRIYRWKQFFDDNIKDDPTETDDEEDDEEDEEEGRPTKPPPIKKEEKVTIWTLFALYSTLKPNESTMVGGLNSNTSNNAPTNGPVANSNNATNKESVPIDTHEMKAIKQVISEFTNATGINLNLNEESKHPIKKKDKRLLQNLLKIIKTNEPKLMETLNNMQI